MKRIIVAFCLFCVMFFCGSCGSESAGEENKKDDFIPDIKIEQIEWSVSEGTVNGEDYVLGEVSNRSEFDLISLRISFTEKKGISKEDKNAFYADIQESQGFDDKWMEEYIASREKLSQPISMYFKIDEGIEKDETKEQIKCYYMGGWTSKNVTYPDLFDPEIVTIQYEKDGKQYTLNYDFSSESYDVEETD